MENSSSKEEYIHMRAKRGQATNSHSLAERVLLFYFGLVKFYTHVTVLGTLINCLLLLTLLDLKF